MYKQPEMETKKASGTHVGSYLQLDIGYVLQVKSA